MLVALHGTIRHAHFGMEAPALQPYTQATTSPLLCIMHIKTLGKSALNVINSQQFLINAATCFVPSVSRNMTDNEAPEGKGTVIGYKIYKNRSEWVNLC